MALKLVKFQVMLSVQIAQDAYKLLNLVLRGIGTPAPSDNLLS